MVGGFPSKSEGNIFVVRWYALVVECSAVLVHIIADVLAAVAWTRLARCIFELDAEREPFAGFGAFPGPGGDVEFDETPVGEFQQAAAGKLWRVIVLALAINKK